MKIIKKSYINENSNTRVKSALFGDVSGKIKTFAIMTPENPMGVEASAPDNNKALKTFKSTLKGGAVQYVPIEGSYGGNKEHSFMLFNIPLKTAINLAQTYKQESFFYGKTSNNVEGDNRNTASIIGYYETRDGGKTYNLVEESNKIVNRDDAEDFFSRHGNFKYNISMDIFEGVKEVKDIDALDKSLDEKYCGSYQMKHRAYSTNGLRKKSR